MPSKRDIHLFCTQDLEKKLESGAAVIEITGEDKVTKQFTITKDMVKGFKRYQDKKFGTYTS